MSPQTLRPRRSPQTSKAQDREPEVLVEKILQEGAQTSAQTAAAIAAALALTRAQLTSA